MAAHVPALSVQASAKVAAGKATKIQKKLRAAKADLVAGGAALEAALEAHSEKAIVAAAEQTQAAEAKVDEAVEDLDAVKQLLSQEAAGPDPSGASGTRTGSGADSVVPFLPKARP